MPDQNAAVKAVTWWTGEGEREAWHGGVALGGPTGDCSGWQRRGSLLHRKPRQAKRVYTWTVGSRLSPGKFVMNVSGLTSEMVLWDIIIADGAPRQPFSFTDSSRNCM